MIKPRAKVSRQNESRSDVTYPPITVVIGNVYDIMQIRGSFSYILLLLELRRSFVIPNYRGLRYKEVRYIKVPLYFVLQI